MAKLAPNPHSPYADATPDVRHIFPSPIFFPQAAPGVLALTACEGMAVVPEQMTETGPDAELPEGLCPDCVTVMRGGEPPARSSSECGQCGSATYHGALCALCRQEGHEDWWPTRLGADYVQPADRPAKWAEMAKSLARDGLGAAEIAVKLCVDEPTVGRLLAGGIQ
ncbi:hypothetical protein [Streptomyces sp. YKOK-I1]